MKKIESIQTEIGQFLTRIIPVPWKKICLFAKAAPGYASVWYAFVEQETDVVCVQDFFWDRYNYYPVDELDVVRNLSKLTLSLYNAYLERFGKDKIWKRMYFILNSDGAIHIDFEFDEKDGNVMEQQYEVYRKFFKTDYKYYKGKYPSKEILD